MPQVIQSKYHVRSFKFFRLRLLSLNNSEIPAYIEKLEKESKALKEDAIKLSWFMRGGATYNDTMLMSQSEREMINSLIKENIETTKKTGLNFF